MIKRMNSKDLMNMLENSQESITDMQNDIDTIRLSLDSRLKVIQNCEEYTNKELNELLDKVNNGVPKSSDNKFVLNRCEIVGGKYSLYGSTIHPYFAKTPNNIFNLNTAAGMIYRDNATILLNTTVRDKWKGALMDDSISGQPVAFDEFFDQDFTLTVNINTGSLLGATDCNVIELLPYIPGSFNITNIDIYTIQDEKTKNVTTPTRRINKPMNNLGATRIFIGSSLSIQKVIFTIHLNYKNTNGKYPFGLKHLYFLKAAYDDTSYAIIKAKRNAYINLISENITMNGQEGSIKSTCSIEGIKMYIDYQDGNLSYEITTSNGIVQNPLPRNVKEFYIKLPINRCLNSIEFENIEDR